MKLKGHTTVGYLVLETLSKKYHLDIQEQSFLRGTVLPDLLPSERIFIHKFDRMIDFLNQSISKFNEETLAIHDFYTTLGMITHYITDTFCLAHNLFHNHPIRHICYELGLNKAVKNFSPDQKLMGQIQSEIILFDHNEEALYKYLKTMHDQYLSKVHPTDHMNYDLDISFAIHTCSMVMGVILERIDSISNNEIVIA